MLDEKTYNLMRRKYGHVGSWAVWSPAGETPRSNTDDMSWADDKDLLKTLNTGFVFVGLNWSSTHGDEGCKEDIAWTNFHSGYCRQNDYKLRYALQGTKYWGSYLTDVIKLYAEVDSGKVRAYLRRHPEVVASNIQDFIEEISLLGNNPVIVALGAQAYQILKKNYPKGGQIVQVKHYSAAIGKEEYQRELLDALGKC